MRTAEVFAIMKFSSKLFQNLTGDLFGGITAGVVALPLALAFGVTSGLGAAAGLYGAIAVGLLAALFGGTPSQISGPTGPMTVVVAGMVAAGTHEPRLIFAAIALAGLLQIVFGVLNLGGYIRYIPYPVVSGFMSGIGVIIILLQLMPLLGAPAPPSVLKGLTALPNALHKVNPTALILGLTTIVLIYLTPRVIKVIPPALLALLTMTIAASALNLDVPRIGPVPSGLPALHLPPLDFATLSTIFLPALTLAALGSIDSLLTSLVADNLTRTRHDSNRELIGQGLGNTLAGLVGGMAGAGATMRTVVNIRSGGKTPLSGAVHALVLLFILLGLGRYAAQIPLSVLAGILITVGIGIIDYRGLKHFSRVPRADALVMAVVLGMTVFVDLIQAVAAGMVMACLLFVKRLSDMPPALPTPLDEFQQSVEEIDVSEEVAQGIYVVHIQSSLFFGNAAPLHEQVAELKDARAIVIDMSLTPLLDQSGAYALSDLAVDLEIRGVKVFLAAIPTQPQRLLTLTGIAPGEIPSDHIRDSVVSAVQAAIEMVNRS
jgi:sulfate permease, SulP family